MDQLLDHVALAELEPVLEERGLVLLQGIRVAPGLLAEALQQNLGKMIRGNDGGLLGLDLTVADAHHVDPVEQFADQVKPEAGAAERRDTPVRGHDDLCVLDGVLEIVFALHRFHLT